MKYRCIPCDSEFELEDGVPRRCPKCLGSRDVEVVTETAKTLPKGNRRWLTPAIILGVAGLVAVVHYLTRQNEGVPPPGIAGSPIAAKESLLSDFEEQLVLKEDPIASTGVVASFATRVTGGDKGEAGLRKLQKEVVALAEQGYWKPHPQREPRAGELLRAGGVAQKLATKSDAPFAALSYEIAAFLLAAAQSQNIESTMVELLYATGDKTPLDFGGKVGRYGVAALDGKKVLTIFDPFGFREFTPDGVKHVVLDSNAAKAPYFAIRALQLLLDQNTTEALRINDLAVKLDPISPYGRSGRGLIFAAIGAGAESVAEFEKAVKLREDAVFRTNLAEIMMVANPTGRQAETELLAAINQLPDYGRAHGLLGMVFLMHQNLAQAEQELQLADRLDPNSPTVAMFWAQFYASQSKSEEAIGKALEATRWSGESLSSLLGLAQIYRATARFEEMRATLDKAIAKADSPTLAEQIAAQFGYDKAAQETDAGSAPSANVDPTDTSSSLKLKLGNSLGGSGAPKLGGGELRLKLNPNE